MPGRVTSIVSKHTVCVDGMPRHVRDIRMRRFGPDRSTDLSTREIEDETRPWHDHGGGTFPAEGVTDVLLPVAEAEEAFYGGESDRDEPSNAEAVGSFSEKLRRIVCQRWLASKFETEQGQPRRRSKSLLC